MGPDIDCPECGAYRVRPGVEMCSVCETAHRLDLRITQLTAERDEARANYAFMVARAADQKLDGYRELGTRAAAAENERDQLKARVEDAESELVRARIALGADDEDTVSEAASKLKARMAELESHELEVSRITGIVYEADYHCHAGPRDQVLVEIERLKSEARDALELRQRVAELEAPPVVPDDYEVVKTDHQVPEDKGPIAALRRAAREPLGRGAGAVRLAGAVAGGSVEVE